MIIAHKFYLTNSHSCTLKLGTTENCLRGVENCAISRSRNAGREWVAVAYRSTLPCCSLNLLIAGSLKLERFRAFALQLGKRLPSVADLTDHLSLVLLRLLQLLCEPPDLPLEL